MFSLHNIIMMLDHKSGVAVQPRVVTCGYYKY